MNERASDPAFPLGYALPMADGSQLIPTGLTKREYFAAAVFGETMRECIKYGGLDKLTDKIERAANISVRGADALMRELSKEPQE